MSPDRIFKIPKHHYSMRSSNSLYNLPRLSFYNSKESSRDFKIPFLSVKVNLVSSLFPIRSTKEGEAQQLLLITYLQEADIYDRKPAGNVGDIVAPCREVPGNCRASSVRMRQFAFSERGYTFKLLTLGRYALLWVTFPSTPSRGLNTSWEITSVLGEVRLGKGHIPYQPKKS